MKKTPPISQILPELDAICEQYKLERKAIAHRNTPAGEHGYLKAYEIWKERNGIATRKTKYNNIVLATSVVNYINKFS